MIIKNEKLLDEFRTPGLCEVCGRKCPKREPHHIYAKGHGGGRRLDIPINLVAVGFSWFSHCHCHHWIHTSDTVSVEAKLAKLFEIASIRESGHYGELIFPDVIEPVIRHFQRLPKETTDDELAELGLFKWVNRPRPSLADGSIELPF